MYSLWVFEHSECTKTVFEMREQIRDSIRILNLGKDNSLVDSVVEAI